VWQWALTHSRVISATCSSVLLTVCCLCAPHTLQAAATASAAQAASGELATSLKASEARNAALAETVDELQDALERQRNSAELREEMLRQVCMGGRVVLCAGHHRLFFCGAPCAVPRLTPAVPHTRTCPTWSGVRRQQRCGTRSCQQSYLKPQRRCCGRSRRCRTHPQHRCVPCCAQLVRRARARSDGCARARQTLSQAYTAVAALTFAATQAQAWAAAERSLTSRVRDAEAAAAAAAAREAAAEEAAAALQVRVWVCVCVWGVPQCDRALVLSTGEAKPCAASADLVLDASRLQHRCASLLLRPPCLLPSRQRARPQRAQHALMSTLRPLRCSCRSSRRQQQKHR
jgi:hypothetical protein